MLKYTGNSIEPYADVINTRSDEAYVDADGNIVKHSHVTTVMVRSQYDLDLFANYPPGTIAHLPGFTTMWQKKADGTWEMFS